MLHINRVTLLGYAGRDPERRTMANGEVTAWFSLATTRKWKGQDGQPFEATEWHRIVTYGAHAKAVESLVRKGAAVLAEGRLAVRAYKDKDNMERQVTEIIVAGPQGMINVLSPKRTTAAEEASADVRDDAPGSTPQDALEDKPGDASSPGGNGGASQGRSQ